MLRYSISLFPLILLAIILQQYIPAFTGLYNARVFLLLAVFLCASITVPLPVMFFLALISGFFWDAQCYLGTEKIDPSIARDSVPALRFGTSILLFGLTGSLIHGFRPLFLQRKLLVVCFLAGLSTYVFMIAEYALLDFMRGTFTINQGVMLQIAYTSLFTILISPIALAILFGIAALFGHPLVETQKRSNSLLGF